MTIKVQIRRGLSTAWTAANTILSSGEIGYETDTKKMKIGDGTTAWTSLAYFPAAASVTFAGGTSNIGAADVSAALLELDNEKQAKTWTPTGNISATTITGALTELDSEKVDKTLSPTGGQVSGSFSSGLTVANTHGASGVQTHHDQNHLHNGADGSGVVAASSVTFTPYGAGNIAATNVQNAIQELRDESATATHTHSTYLSSLYVSANDYTANTTTWTPVTNLAIPYTAGTVTANYWLLAYNNTTANTLRLGWTFGSATLAYSLSEGVAFGTVATASGAGVGAVAVTLGTTTASLPGLLRVSMYLTATGAGTATLQVASFTTTAVGIKKGSWVTYTVQ